MLYQHHHGNVTQPLLLEHLHDLGIDISAGQVNRILTENHDDFHAEKAYRERPDAASTAGLETRFDALVGQKTNYPTSIDNVLTEMRTHRADLLRVLERLEVPLHNNGTESIIRGYVKTRKISGSTRSAAGRRCRDTFASLKKICRKMGLSFWSYLRDRIGGMGTILPSSELIRQRAAAQPGGLADAAPT